MSVSELPEAPEMTPETVAKSVAVLELSNTERVRAPAFRLIGFWNSTSASAVAEPSDSVPVVRKFAVEFQTSWVEAPPRLTVSFESEAAKPTVPVAPNWTTLGPTAPSERVKLPEVSSTDVPTLPERMSGLFAGREPRFLVTRSVPWLTVVKPV